MLELDLNTNNEAVNISKVKSSLSTMDYYSQELKLDLMGSKLNYQSCLAEFKTLLSHITLVKGTKGLCI
jgi:hypothetical protein